MTTQARFSRLLSLLVLPLSWPLAAAEPDGGLPSWFEANRVQAHFENGIQDDLAGLFHELHPAIRSMGANVLTRIFKTTAEGAWWPTAAGHTHEALAGRDLGAEIARDTHGRGLKVFAYYRIMCDDFVEKKHPEWLCRDADGKLVLEPRTRRQPRPENRKHVICFNSPARDLVKTRLLELADRGVDGIYFDSWHMPEVCTCENCRAAYLKEIGKSMNTAAARGSDDYRLVAQFVGRCVVRNFVDWKRAVQAKHPAVVFAIGSSLYPCFDTQMQITASLLHISDTSKTEFSKPFGGSLETSADQPGIEGQKRRRPYWDSSFATPSYDLQNALGWSLTRDSCDGRPPLMWIPFTQTEEEAFYSAAAAVSYGCIASIHPTGMWTRRSASVDTSATRIYRSSYAMGVKVSPQLASARPLRSVLIHVSERSRNARIADPRALWVEFFAPVLGVFEAIKEEHLPVATINDLQLERTLAPETRVLILPHDNEITDPQRAVVRAFEATGGTVLRLDGGQGWHLKSEEPKLKRAIVERILARPEPVPIRARGPVAMHAVFFRKPASPTTVVCLVNSFGWFRSERTVSEKEERPRSPPPCTNMVLEVSASQPPVRRALDVLSGKELPWRREGGKVVIAVPDFHVMSCVAIDQDSSGDPKTSSTTRRSVVCSSTMDGRRRDCEPHAY